MRIALITPGFSADAADWAIPALQTLAQALARQHDLFVFSLRYPAAGRYQWGGFTHQATGGGQRFGLASLNIWRETVAAIVHQHRQTPFDVLHAFWADEPGLVAVLAAARIRRPAIVSLGGGELSYLPDIGYGTQGSFLRRQIIRLSFKGAKAVTAGSTYQLKLARRQGLPAAKAHRLPLGVDTDHFQPGTVPDWERPVIIQAASLTPVKNQPLLLEVVSLVKQEISHIRLILAGDGPLKSELDQLAQKSGINENITWPGAIPYPEMPQLFHQAHLYLQSSRHESQGMAVLEAMACGLPVIGTPVGVTAELACFPASNQAETLAAQAVSIFHDPATYQTRREQARQQVVEQYSLEKTVHNLLHLYRS